MTYALLSPSGASQRTSLMTSQLWFGNIKHQAISWINVDQVLWHPIVSPGIDELNLHPFLHTTVQILFHFSWFSRMSKRFGLRQRATMRSNLPKISRHTLSFTPRSLLYWHNQWSLQVSFPDAHKEGSILEPTPILLHGLRDGRHCRFLLGFNSLAPGRFQFTCR